MKKRNFFLNCILCSLCSMAFLPTLPASAVYIVDGEEVDVSVTKSKYKRSGGGLLSDDLHISSSKYYSTSGAPIEGGGLVIDGTSLWFNVSYSTFKDIIATESGSCIRGETLSFLSNLSDSEFLNNGVVSSAVGKSLYTYGGAIYMEPIVPYELDGMELQVRSDIGEIKNTSFIGNYIDVKASGSGLGLDSAGGAIFSGNIAYENDPEQGSKIPFFVDTGAYGGTTVINYTDAFGGIENSIFDKNKINVKIYDSENSSSLAFGSAISADYVRKIKDSKFTENQMNINVDSSGTGISTVTGGTVFASGISELENTDFSLNTTKQNVSADTARATLSGGVLSTSMFDAPLISNVKFIDNNVDINAIGTKSSRVRILGGIHNSGAIVDNLINSTYSGNVVNVLSSASSSTDNIQGGVLYSYLIRNLDNTTFSGNKLNISSAKTIDLLGGTVYTATSIENILNTSFDNNSTVINMGVEGAKANIVGGVLYSKPYYSSPEDALASGVNKIANTKFEKNSLTINSDIANSTVNVDGGIIRSDFDIKEVDNVLVSDNNLAVSANGKNAIVSISGAGISTPVLSNLKKSTFKNNSAIVSSNAEGVNLSVKGGALKIGQNIDSIQESDFDSNIISATSDGASPVSVLAQGGALYLEGNNVNISNSNFVNNKAIAEGENAESMGGAIYNNATDLTITDSTFKGNAAKKGGAIYSNKNLAIIADTKDVEFSENIADKGADIYINDATLNLKTNSADRKITFGSGITIGDSAANNPDVNVSGNGQVILNAPVRYDGNSYGSLNIMDNSTLKVLDDSNINDSKIKISMDDTSTLDLMNGEGSKIDLYDFELKSENTNLKMDINLNGEQSDYLNLSSSTPSSSGMINISDINILSDSTQKTQTHKVTSSGHKVNINSVQYTNKNKYVITQDTSDNSKINITRENDSDIDGFAEALADTNATSFSALDNVTTDLSVKGNPVTKKFKIFGNNKSIDFSGQDGLIVDNGGELSIENISELKNAGSKGLTVGADSKINIVSSSTDTKIDTDIQLNSNTSILDVKLQNGKSAIFSKKITGDTASKGKLLAAGGSFDFSEIQDVSLESDSATLNFNKSVSGSDLKAINSQVNILDLMENVNLETADSKLNINSSFSNGALNAQRTVIAVANDSYLNGSHLGLDNSAMSLVNNNIGEMKLSGISLTGQNDISVDVDMSNLTADKINADDVTIADGAKLNVSEFNIVKNSTAVGGTVSITDNEELKKHTSTTVSSIDNGLYSYGVSRNDSGDFDFRVTRFDPAVVVAPIAQQAFLASQLNSYNHAFANMDATMLKPYHERMAWKYDNKIAISEVNPYDKYSLYHRSDMQKGPWFRPYGSIENIRFNDGPKVYNYTYGSFIGFDSSMIHMKNGFSSVYSGYIGYNGSMQDYESVRINQNGATVGASTAWYKNNFFTGLTVNGSVSLADGKSDYGKEDFTMYGIGAASKTGYNFQTEDGAFIFQPSLLVSYTYLNTEDYTNASGLNLKADAMNAVQLEPGLKLIFNLGNNWQMYTGAGAVFTIMGKSDFTAANAALPKLSLDPYGQYRLGFQKRWGERSLGFAQTTLRSGGRTGAELQFGMRVAI